eukprot:Awhi_evm2s5812
MIGQQINYQSTNNNNGLLNGHHIMEIDVPLNLLSSNLTQIAIKQIQPCPTKNQPQQQPSQQPSFDNNNGSHNNIHVLVLEESPKTVNEPFPKNVNNHENNDVVTVVVNTIMEEEENSEASDLVHNLVNLSLTNDPISKPQSNHRHHKRASSWAPRSNSQSNDYYDDEESGDENGDDIVFTKPVSHDSSTTSPLLKFDPDLLVLTEQNRKLSETCKLSGVCSLPPCLRTVNSFSNSRGVSWGSEMVTIVIMT